MREFVRGDLVHWVAMGVNGIVIDTMPLTRTAIISTDEAPRDLIYVDMNFLVPLTEEAGEEGRLRPWAYDVYRR